MSAAGRPCHVRSVANPLGNQNLRIWSSRFRRWWSSHATPLRLRWLLGVAPELLAHRRQDLVRELGLAARLEPIDQRGREHMDGNALVDRGKHRPTALA